MQGPFTRTFSPTYTLSKGPAAFEQTKITLANVAISIANVQITTALQGITIMDLKAYVERVEADYKQKAVFVRICLYMDSVNSRKAAGVCRRAFEEVLAGSVDDV